MTEYNILEKISANAKKSKHSKKKTIGTYCLNMVTLVFFFSRNVIEQYGIGLLFLLPYEIFCQFLHFMAYL
jgi:hypothetical protein